jgi:hypothetical protein
LLIFFGALAARLASFERVALVFPFDLAAFVSGLTTPPR